MVVSFDEFCMIWSGGSGEVLMLCVQFHPQLGVVETKSFK